MNLLMLLQKTGCLSCLLCQPFLWSIEKLVVSVVSFVHSETKAFVLNL